MKAIAHSKPLFAATDRRDTAMVNCQRELAYAAASMHHYLASLEPPGLAPVAGGRPHG